MIEYIRTEGHSAPALPARAPPATSPAALSATGRGRR